VKRFLVFTEVINESRSMKNTQQTSQSPKPAQAKPSSGQKRITLSVALKAHPTHQKG